MLILPAVDIRNGKCVRLRQGRADQETVFSDDPVAMARRWVEAGGRYLHVVDLDGAFQGTPRNLEIVKRIVGAVGCPVELGGGLRTDEAVEEALAAGIDRAILGTRAATDPQWLAALVARFPGRMAVGVDAVNGIVKLAGWTESSSLRAIDLIDRLNGLGLAAVIYTDISRDGELIGPNFEATEEVVRRSRHPVIASGGVTTPDDVRRLAAFGVAGAIIGRALYEGTLTLPQALAAAQSPR